MEASIAQTIGFNMIWRPQIGFKIQFFCYWLLVFKSVFDKFWGRGSGPNRFLSKNPSRTWGQNWILMKFLIFSMFSACPDFSLFSKILVCYNGYHSLSWIKISSRFLFLIKSYVESTIQILKIIVLRLRGEKSLMIK